MACVYTHAQVGWLEYTSILSFMDNGTLWSFQIYEILLSKGISRSEKKESRSYRDAFTVSCLS